MVKPKQKQKQKNKRKYSLEIYSLEMDYYSYIFDIVNVR